MHFRDHHNTYYSCHKYVTEEDETPEHSQLHPDLKNAPKTEKAINGKKRKGQKKAGLDKSQRKRCRDKALTVYDVSQIIQEEKITK